MSNVMFNHIRRQINHHPRYYRSNDDNSLGIILAIIVMVIGIGISMALSAYFMSLDTTRQTTSKVNTERQATEFRDTYASVYDRAGQLSDAVLVDAIMDNLEPDRITSDSLRDVFVALRDPWSTDHVYRQHGLHSSSRSHARAAEKELSWARTCYDNVINELEGYTDDEVTTALVDYLTGDSLDHDGLCTAYSVISINRSLGLLAQPQLNRF